MTSAEETPPDVIEYLGNGLVVRRARREDAASVATLVSAAHAATGRGADSVPAFIGKVTSVLEARLAASPVTGFSGQILVSFFRSGPRLLLDRGRIRVEPWPRADYYLADACFTGLTFLPMLMGFRSLEEFEFAYPDCFGPWSEASRLALIALFPKQPSSVWPVG